MKSLTSYYSRHGTKILGTAQVIVAGFPAISGLISTDHVKYWLAANVVLGAMTLNRGFDNSNKAKNANP